jgi:hypothetical protein
VLAIYPRLPAVWASTAPHSQSVPGSAPPGPTPAPLADVPATQQQQQRQRRPRQRPSSGGRERSSRRGGHHHHGGTTPERGRRRGGGGGSAERRQSAGRRDRAGSGQRSRQRVSVGHPAAGQVSVAPEEASARHFHPLPSNLAEIYLCHTCSCHEILRTETPGQEMASPARHSGGHTEGGRGSLLGSGLGPSWPEGDDAQRRWRQQQQPPLRWDLVSGAPVRSPAPVPTAPGVH